MKVTIIDKNGTSRQASDWFAHGWWGFRLKLRMWFYFRIGYPIYGLFRRVALLPIWLITRCLKPFLPPTHPWKQKRLSLAWWSAGATSDAFAFSVTFWVCALTIAIVLAAELWPKVKH